MLYPKFRRSLSPQSIAFAICLNAVLVAPIVRADGMKHDHKAIPMPSISPNATPTASPEKDSKAIHKHTSIEIPKGQPVPKVTLTITPDAMKGWNMQVKTENFSFAPERASQDSKTTEGHAHLFLNGKKIARIYSNWGHIPSLPKGKNELRITLNTNMHEDLTVAGKVIEAIAIVEVP
jgi:hypothetical protein